MALSWWLAPCLEEADPNSPLNDPESPEYDPWPGNPLASRLGPCTEGVWHTPPGLRIHCYDKPTGMCLAGFDPGCAASRGNDWVYMHTSGYVEGGPVAGNVDNLQAALDYFEAHYGRAPTSLEVF